MRLPKRDLIATGLVTVAVVLYLLWGADWAFHGTVGTLTVGAVILGLGVAASAAAVVPGFDRLIHGSRTYLAATSLLGVVALAGGLQMILMASGVGLTVMVAAMVVLWAIATVHHVRLARVEHSTNATRIQVPAG
jgi:hypothetical protein